MNEVSVSNQVLERVKAVESRMEALEKAVKDGRKTANQNSRDIQDIKEEYPLLPPEADDLSREVRRKGVEVLGSKKSPAYKNTSIRRSVYQDIYLEIKRQYGLINEDGRQLSYKKLKRKYFKGALDTVHKYEAPISLANDIDAENELEDDE